MIYKVIAVLLFCATLCSCKDNKPVQNIEATTYKVENGQ